MKYKLGLSYNGTPDSQEQDKRFSVAEKPTLEGLAAQNNGVSSFTNALYPFFVFDSEQDLIAFRKSIVGETNSNKLHYHRIDPLVTIPV